VCNGIFLMFMHVMIRVVVMHNEMGEYRNYKHFMSRGHETYT